MNARFVLSLSLVLLTLAGCGSGPETSPQYAAGIDAWHAARIDRLRSDTGWLTLVGLHELQMGLNLVGSHPGAQVRLIDKAPSYVGRLQVTEQAILIEADPGAFVQAEVASGLAPVTRLLIRTDADGAPTILHCGSLVFHVIDRQGRLFLRVKDRESELLKSFEGIERFAVDARWRAVARLEGEPGTIEVPNALGQVSEESVPGVLVFEMDGRELRVSPTGEKGGALFLVFGDETNGQATYPGGRFLSIAEPDESGNYVVDFNLATNPPCVFTPYATCPLPSPQNVLPIAIEAGEKMWGDPH